MKITKNRLLLLFRHEILPDDRENDLESNELCTYIGKTGNTGKNLILVKITKNRFYRYSRFHRYWLMAYSIGNGFLNRQVNFRTEIISISYGKGPFPVLTSDRKSKM